MNPLDAACRLLVEQHGAEFVVGYGSFASETHAAEHWFRSYPTRPW